MKLSRFQSRFIAAGIILAFFLFGIQFSKSKRRASLTTQKETTETVENVAAPDTVVPTSAPLAEPTGSPQSESQFVLNTFHRSETKNGKKVWEVNAKRGAYNPLSNEAVVSEAKLLLYREKGETVEINATTAALKLQGSEMLSTHAYEGVKLVYNDEMTIETDDATYDQANGSVSAPGSVKISSERMDIVGASMSVDVKTRVMTLSGGVETVIKPKLNSGSGKGR